MERIPKLVLYLQKRISNQVCVIERVRSKLNGLRFQTIFTVSLNCNVVDQEIKAVHLLYKTLQIAPTKYTVLHAQVDFLISKASRSANMANLYVTSNTYF
jgi:hypothetical protein